MLSDIQRFDCHTHTHKSNIINRDSTNRETDLIDKAIELNLKGIAITDHGNLSAHVDALLHLKKVRKKAKEKVEEEPFNMQYIETNKRASNFKLGLGTEIYLVDRTEVTIAREKYEPTKFYHLILIPKNYDGYRALAELSSKSWEESFHYRGVERIPTYKDYFFEWASQNKGNIIVTSACLGSEFATLVLEFAKDNKMENRMNIDRYMRRMVGAFGEDFYIEVQPSFGEEQIVYNKLAFSIAQAYGVEVVINTDAHYLSKELKDMHSTYLKSQNAERETESFYASTYLMSVQELMEYFDYVSPTEFLRCMNNSLEIADKIEEFDLHQEIEVPKTRIEFKEGIESILAPLIMQEKNKYKYIYLYGTSVDLVDRTLLQQIELGLLEKNIDITEEVLLRLNTELESLWEISEKLHQRLSSYYLLTKEIVEIIWRVSLVGISRGSAGAFYICYLLGITQINPLEYNLPDWRHISATRPELPDIDIDSEAGQRSNIMDEVKKEYGYYNVLNIGTFKTEGTASAIQTICRGMGIPTGEATYLSSLAVEGMSVKDCLEEFDTHAGAKLLIKEMMAYEGLIENVIAIEGLVCGRSVHASGVYIFNSEFWNHNAMMKAPKGQWITQYDMKCSDYQGGLKIDFLTIEALDRIRKDLELMIEDGVIEDKGSIKETYNAYIHPDILEKEDEEMWKLLPNLLDAFQYYSVQGKNAINKIGIQNFREALEGNALMRLSCEGEQPIDRFIKHKKDINIWFNEMRAYGLTESEIEVLKSHLLESYGVASTQEAVMRLSMDKNIGGFDLVWANKLRKAIAKAKAKHMIDEVHAELLRKGQELGNRKELIEYVWDKFITPMLGYAFSEPHLAGLIK